jgi:hypothetical protein
MLLSAAFGIEEEDVVQIVVSATYILLMIPIRRFFSTSTLVWRGKVQDGTREVVVFSSRRTRNRV